MFVCEPNMCKLEYQPCVTEPAELGLFWVYRPLDTFLHTSSESCLPQKAKRHPRTSTAYRMAEVKSVIGIDLGATTW